jgi:hypothetical protein
VFDFGAGLSNVESLFPHLSPVFENCRSDNLRENGILAFHLRRLITLNVPSVICATGKRWTNHLPPYANTSVLIQVVDPEDGLICADCSRPLLGIPYINLAKNASIVAKLSRYKQRGARGRARDSKSCTVGASRT